MLKPFRFSQGLKGFRLVVFAPSRQAAQKYVKREAISSIAHRSLKYIGEGHPPDPEKWVAATVKE